MIKWQKTRLRREKSTGTEWQWQWLYVDRNMRKEEHGRRTFLKSPLNENDIQCLIKNLMPFHARRIPRSIFLTSCV